MTKAKQDDRFQILTSLVFVAPSWARRSFRQHRRGVVSGSRPRLYSPFTPASPSTTKPRRSRSTGTLGFFQVVGRGSGLLCLPAGNGYAVPSTRRTRTNRRSIRNLNFLAFNEASSDAVSGYFDGPNPRFCGSESGGRRRRNARTLVARGMRLTRDAIESARIFSGQRSTPHAGAADGPSARTGYPRASTVAATGTTATSGNPQPRERQRENARTKVKRAHRPAVETTRAGRRAPRTRSEEWNQRPTTSRSRRGAGTAGARSPQRELNCARSRSQPTPP
jgi:hypothetical protein